MRDFSGRLRHIARVFIKPLVRRKERSTWQLDQWTRWRLMAQPHLQPGSCEIGGRPFVYADAYWFLHQCAEILDDEIYFFKAASDAPRIVDCGANVGLSVLYFKKLYPAATIVAFEPDPDIFHRLEENVCSYAWQDITLEKKAVWTEDGFKSFLPDGSVGGALTDQGADETTTQVCTVATARLRNYLQEPVDFLKIDIEGAEWPVLQDCKDLLPQVGHLFLEYHADSTCRQVLPEMLQTLEEAGFRYYIKEAGAVSRPFTLPAQPPQRWDLQLNIFAFRPKKR